MNKQEAIKKIEGLKELSRGALGYDWIELGIDKALDVVKQLDETVKPQEPKHLAPEKPVVPQFVADFYESIKDDFEVGVYDLCVNLYTCNLEGKIKYWFDCDDNKPIETLTKMNLYGYEVNKDKLYTVELPNNGGYYHIILTRNAIGKIKLISSENVNWKESDYTQLTETEIKKDFEWAFRWAKEVKE